MFTGIVKDVGVVKNFGNRGGLYRLDVEAKEMAGDLGIGDSVSVSGVCLTLVEKKKGLLSFDVMEETVRRSTLASLKTQDRVNLEGSLKAGGPIGGHFVQGHIDCVGKIKSLKKRTEDFEAEVEFPREFASLVVEKGSVALDGVSLTVGKADRASLSVYLIPHTLKTTILGSKKARDPVNIEFDILGKYMARLKDAPGPSSITEGFLRENGF